MGVGCSPRPCISNKRRRLLTPGAPGRGLHQATASVSALSWPLLEDPGQTLVSLRCERGRSYRQGWSEVTDSTAT